MDFRKLDALIPASLLKAFNNRLENAKNEYAGTDVELWRDNLEKDLNLLCKEMDSGVFYPNYPDHAYKHSFMILQYIGSFLGNRCQKLTLSELYLIFYCAYTHDIAMAFSWDDLLTLLIKDEGIKLLSELLEFVTKYDDGYDPNRYQAARHLKAFYLWIDKMKERNGQANDIPKISDFKEEYHLDEQNIIELTKALSEFLRPRHGDHVSIAFQAIKLQIQDRAKVERNFCKMLIKCCQSHAKGLAEIVLAKNNLQSFTIYGVEDRCRTWLVSWLLLLGDLMHLGSSRFEQDYEKNHSLSKENLRNFAMNDNVTSRYLSYSKITHEIETDDIFVAQLSYHWHEYLKILVTWIQSNYNNSYFDLNDSEYEVFTKKPFEAQSISVLYHGNTFTDDDAARIYHFDHTRAMELISGQGIYRSKLVFLREVIQNSIDATMIAFFNNQCRVDGQVQQVPLDTVYNVHNLSHQNNEIKVHLSVPEKGNTEEQDETKIRIRISDHGCGITDNRLDSMTSIGKEKQDVKEYMKLLNEAPLWLHPSAKFGIGLQTIFEVCDDFSMVSFPDREKGLRIEFHSLRENGYVGKQSIDNLDHSIGTTTEIDVPIQRILGEIPDVTAPQAEGIEHPQKPLIKKAITAIAQYIQDTFIAPPVPIQVKIDDMLARRERLVSELPAIHCSILTSWDNTIPLWTDDSSQTEYRVYSPDPQTFVIIMLIHKLRELQLYEKEEPLVVSLRLQKNLVDNPKRLSDAFAFHKTHTAKVSYKGSAVNAANIAAIVGFDTEIEVVGLNDRPNEKFPFLLSREAFSPSIKTAIETAVEKAFINLAHHQSKLYAMDTAAAFTQEYWQAALGTFAKLFEKYDVMYPSSYLHVPGQQTIYYGDHSIDPDPYLFKNYSIVKMETILEDTTVVLPIKLTLAYLDPKQNPQPFKISEGFNPIPVIVYGMMHFRQLEERIVVPSWISDLTVSRQSIDAKQLPGLCYSYPEMVLPLTYGDLVNYGSRYLKIRDEDAETKTRFFDGVLTEWRKDIRTAFLIDDVTANLIDKETGIEQASVKEKYNEVIRQMIEAYVNIIAERIK